MEIDFTRNFIKLLGYHDRSLTIFKCSFLKLDNPGITNSDKIKKVEVYVNASIDKLNEDLYIIEFSNDSLSRAKYLVDGMQLSRYNQLRLYFKDTSTRYLDWDLAGVININSAPSMKVFDYARNLVYVDLSNFKVNANIDLIKLEVDAHKDPVYGTIIDHKHLLNSKYLYSELTKNLACSSKAILNYIRQKAEPTSGTEIALSNVLIDLT